MGGGEGRRASWWLFGPALAWVLVCGAGLMATARGTPPGISEGMKPFVTTA